MILLFCYILIPAHLAIAVNEAWLLKMNRQCNNINEIKVQKAFPIKKFKSQLYTQLCANGCSILLDMF